MRQNAPKKTNAVHAVSFLLAVSMCLSFMFCFALWSSWASLCMFLRFVFASRLHSGFPQPPCARHGRPGPSNVKTAKACCFFFSVLVFVDLLASSSVTWGLNSGKIPRHKNQAKNGQTGHNQISNAKVKCRKRKLTLRIILYEHGSVANDLIRFRGCLGFEAVVLPPTAFAILCCSLVVWERLHSKSVSNSFVCVCVCCSASVWATVRKSFQKQLTARHRDILHGGILTGLRQVR